MNKKIDKILKLLKQSESAKEIGNADEALAFAERAQTLMEKYNVEMSDVEFEEKRAEGIDEENLFAYDIDGRRKPWRSMTAAIIADQFNCKVLSLKGSGMCSLIGNQQNRNVAEFVIERIIGFMTKQCQHDHDIFRAELKARKMDQGFKQSWRSAFIARLCKRYEARRVRMEWEMEGTENERGLIRVDTERQDVEDFCKDIPMTKAEPKFDTTNEVGLFLGSMAGNKVNIEVNQLEAPE